MEPTQFFGSLSPYYKNTHIANSCRHPSLCVYNYLLINHIIYLPNYRHFLWSSTFVINNKQIHSQSWNLVRICTSRKYWKMTQFDTYRLRRAFEYSQMIKSPISRTSKSPMAGINFKLEFKFVLGKRRSWLNFGPSICYMVAEKLSKKSSNL